MKSKPIHEPRQFDEIDLRILHYLQQHGEFSNVDLSERVHLSAAQCSRRVQNLLRSGVITGYTALVDREQLGFGVLAFVSVTFDKAQYKRLGDLHTSAHHKVTSVLTSCSLARPEDPGAQRG